MLNASPSHFGPIYDIGGIEIPQRSMSRRDIILSIA
jgi:hypothetical protein